MTSTLAESRYQPDPYNDPTSLEGIWHLDGLSWFDAPNPPPRHECWPQTKGFCRAGSLPAGWVFRCACGAMALDEPRRFLQKNANLDPKHTIYSGDYYPPRPSLGSRLRRLFGASS